ncbi:MAG TPA: hypothetical protein VJG90_08240 [Candidatus Nanoarchaeia archaeon]|nr:hypothetical protein [Candidatus Nanoarchaeia archaeon]
MKRSLLPFALTLSLAGSPPRSSLATPESPLDIIELKAVVQSQETELESLEATLNQNEQKYGCSGQPRYPMQGPRNRIRRKSRAPASRHSKKIFSTSR